MAAITNARASSFSIGELSRATGVNIETIRYYERVKVLPPPPRTEGGRRVYGPEDKRVLAFVRRGRELGFTLDEVRTLLELGAPADASCAEVREIAGAHLADVRAKLADLQRLEAILTEAVAKCTGDTVPVCPVLDILDERRSPTREEPARDGRRPARNPGSARSDRS